MAHEFGVPIGTGTIEKRGKNRWRIRFNLGRNPATGKYAYSPARNVQGTKTDARRAADEYKAELLRKAEGHGAGMLLCEYVERWQHLRLSSPDIKAATCQRDAPVLARINATLGQVPLAELNLATIRDAYASVRERGEMTESQFHVFHQKLKQVLGDAVAEGAIPANPAANKALRAPRPECTSRNSFSPSEARRLSLCPHDAAEESRFMAIVIGLATGMRRGEVLGLQWKHLTLSEEAGRSSVSVQQQLVKKSRGYEKTKTRKSTRVLGIDDYTASRLTQWKESQRIYLERLGLAQTDETPVVIDSEGGAHDPDNYYTWFTRFCDRHGFGGFYDDEGNRVSAPRLNERGFPVDDDDRPYSRSNRRPRVRRHYVGLRFHELRHTNISLMIANGVDFRAASERAGHSKVSTTMDIYSHAFPENDRAAATLIGSFLG